MKALLLNEVFEIKFLMKLHVLRFLKSENPVFSGWSMRVCMCESIINTNQKRTKGGSLNLVL